jgi:hypothetical protein
MEARKGVVEKREKEEREKEKRDTGNDGEDGKSEKELGKKGDNTMAVEVNASRSSDVDQKADNVV